MGDIATAARRLAATLACLFAAGAAAQDTAAHAPLAYVDWLSHAAVGGLAALAGIFAHRAWSRRRWRAAPAGLVNEAVLALDLVDSTQLADRHGDALAMRARMLLERRARAAASAHGAAFVETTGDGCMMTFASVDAAARAAAKLLRGLQERPPDMAPGPPLEVRAGLAYGELVLDVRGARHGAVINKAFRLMSADAAAFVAVEGEPRLAQIPERNRAFVDEDASHVLEAARFPLRQVGVCRLKGFAGFHRVYELQQG